MTKTMTHVEELRHVASLDQCAWGYAQKLMRSSADEIERLDADAAGAQAELASVKACWAEALENVATRNREIEQLRLERHQLRNELTAAGLENEQLRAAMRKALNVWDNYRITDTETEQAIKAECEALVGAAAEPGASQPEGYSQEYADQMRTALLRISLPVFINSKPAYADPDNVKTICGALNERIKIAQDVLLGLGKKSGEQA